MQIVIPMSGFGERFRRVGYTVPKPLIEVDGKTIIEHVIDLFPGQHEFVFVCNRDHLDEPSFRMAEILRRRCPNANIVGIAPHKFGPVHAVLEVANLIRLDEPVVVNYCDFSCVWDFDSFQSYVAATGCDGAIAAYTGFHPHMLRSFNFAYLKQDGRRVVDIQEKAPFTSHPMEEHASSGTYYFKTGRVLLEFAQKSMKAELAVNDEYYVSMVYKPMIEEGLNVVSFSIEHFMQWGTPEDFEEYRYFSNMFRLLAQGHVRPKQHGSVLVPMAGLGQRFQVEGYERPKPLLPVAGRPMAIAATECLPMADDTVFVLRRDLPHLAEIEDALKKTFATSKLVVLDGSTDGQASTCAQALHSIDQLLPLTIGACDSGAIYDPAAFEAFLVDDNTDVIVWVARGYPGAISNPQMYGWVDAREGQVRAVSVKTPLRDCATDPIIIGTFTFKRGADFMRAVDRMMSRKATVNGEYYVDTCINDAVKMGLQIRTFEVQSYLCWGTPNDLKCFQYWQTCFSKWKSHPYREQDGLGLA